MISRSLFHLFYHDDRVHASGQRIARIHENSVLPFNKDDGAREVRIEGGLKGDRIAVHGRRGEGGVRPRCKDRL